MVGVGVILLLFCFLLLFLVGFSWFPGMVGGLLWVLLWCLYIWW